MSEQQKYDAFVSYSILDAADAEIVASSLHDAGLHVWFAPWNLVPGQLRNNASDQAIKETWAFVICIGPTGFDAVQQQEIRATAPREAVEKGKPLIPVLLPGAQLPHFVRGLFCVDFRKGIGNPREMARLIATVRSVPVGGEVDQQQNIGDQLWAVANVKDALDHYEKALQIAQAAYGENHPRVAELYVRIGNIKQNMSDYATAERFLKKSYEINIEAYGANSLQVAAVRNYLGIAYRNSGQLKNAKQQFEKALAINEEVLGPNHPRVARLLNNLGSVLHDLFDLDSAETYFRKALEIDEKILGPDHPIIAIRKNNIGIVLKDKGNLESARAYFEQALILDEKALGSEDPAVATLLNNLGSVLRDLGQLKTAEDHFKRALAIDEKALGENHPRVAIRLNNLGSVLRDLGNLTQAQKNFERALEIRKKDRGEEDPDYLSGLGSVLVDQGYAADAIPLFEHALNVDKDLQIPLDDPNPAITRNNLAHAFWVQGNRQQALESYEQAYESLQESMGPDHPLSKMVRQNLEQAQMRESAT